MRGSAGLVALFLVLAGCGSPGPTPNPALTPAPLPEGWNYTSWSDPDLEIALPSDWTSFDPTASTAAEAMASYTAEQRGLTLLSDKQVASGVVRASQIGQVTTPLGTVGEGGLWVMVETGDKSLDGFVDRATTDARQAGVSPTKTTVVLPAGVAVRLSYGGKFGDWPAFAQRDYLFALPDGRSLTIGIWSNDASDTAIDDFATRVISTLRAQS